jgi:hypothetical protein
MLMIWIYWEVSQNIINKNTETFIDASKEAGL